MIVREIEARSILTASKLPEADYCLNPYAGCSHACAYCYARFMGRFTGHAEPWGQYVDVKVNAAGLLRKQLSAKHKPAGAVLLGSVTDAYQPLERKYQLTRAILGELAASDLTVSILTKSDLVLRDVDLLKGLERCSVGLTLTSLDDRVRAAVEPHAAPVERRLAALRQLHAEGIRTFAFLGPILPGLTDLRALVDAVAGSADAIWAEALNTGGGTWPPLEAALRARFPEALPALAASARNAGYWDEVEDQVRSLCAEYGKPLVGFFRH